MHGISIFPCIMTLISIFQLFFIFHIFIFKFFLTNIANLKKTFFCTSTKALTLQKDFFIFIKHIVIFYLFLFRKDFYIFHAHSHTLCHFFFRKIIRQIEYLFALFVFSSSLNSFSIKSFLYRLSAQQRVFFVLQKDFDSSCLLFCVTFFVF